MYKWSKIDPPVLANQSLSLAKPRLGLCEPGQELATGEDLVGAGWSTTVPRESLGLEAMRSELGVTECMCSWGCRCEWLLCWCSVSPLPAFAWACSSAVAAYRGWEKRKIQWGQLFQLYWSQETVQEHVLTHILTEKFCYAAQLCGISPRFSSL